MDLNIGESDPQAAWVPEACTLPSVEQPLRVAEFDEVFANAVRGDLFRHVNGRWIARTEIPAYRARHSTFRILAEEG
jgi:predicted metalloendopeptidase